MLRLWQERPETFLDAGAALIPLAPLTDVKEADLPRLVEEMGARINRGPAPRAAILWTATYLLM